MMMTKSQQKSTKLVLFGGKLKLAAEVESFFINKPVWVIVDWGREVLSSFPHQW